MSSYWASTGTVINAKDSGRAIRRKLATGYRATRFADRDHTLVAAPDGRSDGGGTPRRLPPAPGGRCLNRCGTRGPAAGSQ